VEYLEWVQENSIMAVELVKSAGGAKQVQVSE